MLKRAVIKLVICLAVLVATGLARRPFETRLADRMLAANLLEVPPGQTIWEQVGQSSFLAVLGGFRSLVSTYLELHAVSAWEVTDWDALEQDYWKVLTLTPRNTQAWLSFTHYLAYDAAANMELQQHIPEARRKYLSESYVRKGIDVLQRGIDQLPGDGKLQLEMGRLRRQKLQDYCGAAENFRKAAELGTLPGFSNRMVGYMLAQCPGRERESYEWLKRLWFEDEENRTGTSQTLLIRLEEQLKIPADEGIPGLAMGARDMPTAGPGRAPAPAESPTESPPAENP